MSDDPSNNHAADIETAKVHVKRICKMLDSAKSRVSHVRALLEADKIDEAAFAFVEAVVKLHEVSTAMKPLNTSLSLVMDDETKVDRQG